MVGTVTDGMRDVYLFYSTVSGCKAGIMDDVERIFSNDILTVQVGLDTRTIVARREQEDSG